MTTFSFVADDLTGAADVLAQAHRTACAMLVLDRRRDHPLGGRGRDRRPRAVAGRGGVRRPGPRPARADRADRPRGGSLQGLLDLRQPAHPGQHRSRHRAAAQALSRARVGRRCPRPTAVRPLHRLQQPLRGVRRSGAPPRPAPGDVAASVDPHARGRPAPGAGQAVHRRFRPPLHLPAYADGSFTERWRPARATPCRLRRGCGHRRPPRRGGPRPDRAPYRPPGRRSSWGRAESWPRWPAPPPASAKRSRPSPTHSRDRSWWCRVGVEHHRRADRRRRGARLGRRGGAGRGFRRRARLQLGAGRAGTRCPPAATSSCTPPEAAKDLAASSGEAR